MLRLIIMLGMILVPTISFSQNFDKQLFKMICDKISEREEIYKEKSLLFNNGIYMLEDIVYNTKTVYYSDSTSSIAKEFAKKPIEDQLYILETESLPIFPLQDTLFIFDKQSFLRENMNYGNKHFFKIAEQERNTQFRQNLLIIDNYKLRGNTIILSISFANHSLKIILFATITKGEIAFVKMIPEGDW